MKLTKPSDMVHSSTKHIQSVISLFEQQFEEEDKNQQYYHLVIVGEFSRNICDEIEKAYLEAGWSKVICKTSSENNERPGLTGLQLYV